MKKIKNYWYCLRQKMHNNIFDPSIENIVYTYVRCDAGGYSSSQVTLGADSFVFAWKFHMTKPKRLKQINPKDDPLKQWRNRDES